MTKYLIMFVSSIENVIEEVAFPKQIIFKDFIKYYNWIK